MSGASLGHVQGQPWTCSGCVCGHVHGCLRQRERREQATWWNFHYLILWNLGEYTGWYLHEIWWLHWVVLIWNLMSTLGGTPYEIWWVHWVVLIWNLVSTLGSTYMKSGEYTGWYLYESGEYTGWYLYDIWWVHWVVLIWNLVSTLGGTPYEVWWVHWVVLLVKSQLCGFFSNSRIVFRATEPQWSND